MSYPKLFNRDSYVRYNDENPDVVPFTIYENGLDVRTFEEEWQALQWMDEQREHTQRLANEIEEPITVEARDHHGDVIGTYTCQPLPKREKFTGHDRPKLEEPVKKKA